MPAPQIIGIDHARPGSDCSMVRIGPHTLICGDAYAIRPTLGWFDADVMDPPYLIRTSGGGQFRKKRHHMNEITQAGIDEGFDHSIINPLLCGAVVTFCHNDQLPILLPYLHGNFTRCSTLAWLKANPMPLANKSYRADAEPYIHAWQKGYEPTGTLADLRRYVRASASRTDKKRFGHPTIKPAKVMDKIMRNLAGETVCDPFMGTGSTGVAAIKAGKRFTGIENNPRWFEAAVTRITEAVQGISG